MSSSFLKVRRYFHADVAILTGTAAYADVVAARSGLSMFLTFMTLSITTHVADTYTVDDDGSGPVIATHLDITPQAAGVPSVVTWDFGDYGTPITGNIDVSHSSTGVARLHLEGYFI